MCKKHGISAKIINCSNTNELAWAVHYKFEISSAPAVQISSALTAKFVMYNTQKHAKTTKK